MTEDTPEGTPDPDPHPHLRLVYSRPADLPPLPPSRPVNLAIAIERHLMGSDGFTDEQFVFLFARTSAAERAPSF
jgi:hypothetical protein